MSALAELQQEIAAHKLSKEAGLWSSFKAFAGRTGLGERIENAVLSGVAAAGAAAVGAGGAATYGAVRSKIDRSRGYGKMMEMNPGLRKMDADEVRHTYNSLATLNPAYARDPLVAGSFVAKTLDSGVGKSLGLGGGYIDTQTARNITQREEPDAVLQQFMAHAKPDDWKNRQLFGLGVSKNLEGHRAGIRAGEQATQRGFQTQQESDRQRFQMQRERIQRRAQDALSRKQRGTLRDIARQKNEATEDLTYLRHDLSEGLDPRVGP